MCMNLSGQSENNYFSPIWAEWCPPHSENDSYGPGGYTPPIRKITFCQRGIMLQKGDNTCPTAS